MEHFNGRGCLRQVCFNVLFAVQFPDLEVYFLSLEFLHASELSLAISFLRSFAFRMGMSHAAHFSTVSFILSTYELKQHTIAALMQ